MNSIQEINIFIKDIFIKENFHYVELPLVYKSEIFYESSGEEIRRRMFSFNDKSGNEMCLRPDLTIPTCKSFLENPLQKDNGRLCYSGPIFRSSDHDLSQSLELNQSGIEVIYNNDLNDNKNFIKELETIKLALSTLEQLNINDIKVRIGSISFFNLFIDCLDLPQRWKQRLLRHLYRRHYFEKLLTRIRKGVGYDEERKLVIQRDVFSDETIFNQEINDILAREDPIKLGSRTIDEISNRFNLKSESVVSAIQGSKIADLVIGFLTLTGDLKSFPTKVDEFIRANNVSLFDEGLKTIDHLSSTFVKNFSNIEFIFDCDFGHSIEFYDGIIFEIIDQKNNILISGGRYDKLLTSLGDKNNFAAIGFATNNNQILETLV